MDQEELVAGAFISNVSGETIGEIGEFCRVFIGGMGLTLKDEVCIKDGSAKLPDVFWDFVPDSACGTLRTSGEP